MSVDVNNEKPFLSSSVIGYGLEYKVLFFCSVRSKFINIHLHASDLTCRTFILYNN